jgi:phenylacetate-CoA oxygenase PaaI subunit
VDRDDRGAARLHYDSNRAVSEPDGPAAVFDDSVAREADEQAREAVSSSARRVESAGELDPAVRPAMYALLSSLADNKYVLGRRYAEWCTGAPKLEAAVAAAAMAQDELGHARSFYPLLRGFPGATEADTMEEAGWQTRPTSALACLDARFGSWGQFVATNFVVDTAFTILFQAAEASPYEPLRQRARKIVQEEQGHWVHARGWVRQLAIGEAAREDLSSSLGLVWGDAIAWFGQDDDPVLGTLSRCGMLRDAPERLRGRLLERLTPILESVGVADGLVSRALPWERWDRSARRLRTPG